MKLPYLTPKIRQLMQLISINVIDLMYRNTYDGLIALPMLGEHLPVHRVHAQASFYTSMPINHPRATDLIIPPIRSLSVIPKRITSLSVIPKRVTSLSIIPKRVTSLSMIPKRVTSLSLAMDPSVDLDWYKWWAPPQPKCPAPWVVKTIDPRPVHRCVPGASKLLCPPIGHRVMRAGLRFLAK
jgi:hypothetical protein